MNRTQRRAQMRAEKRTQQPPTPPRQLTVQHGHSDTHVLVVFPQAINNIQLTPEQAKGFIASLEHSLKGLLEHQAKKGAANG